MQLKKGAKNIKQALCLATCSLLGTPHTVVADDWRMDVSGLYYAESERVTVNKLQSLLTRKLESGQLNVQFVYDTMTGSSPNGRLYTRNSDTGSVAVTTASGFAFNVNGQTGAAAGSKPWLTKFTDTRRGMAVDWETRLTRVFRNTFNVSTSTENDYFSVGGAYVAALDLWQKTSTLSMGAGINMDQVDPIGGIPEGLGKLECANSTPNIPNWIDCDSVTKRYGAAEKMTTNYMLGFTQVWNKKTLFQVNYSNTQIEGYLTDPYKQISVIDAAFDTEIAVLHEKRPSRRNTQSTYWKMVQQSHNQVTHLSYRYFWDDWSITSHTLDVQYRWNFHNQYLRPHIRLNSQSAAYFHDTNLRSTDERPVFFSADNRLGRQNTYTVGVKYSVKLGEQGELGLRIEKILQTYPANPLPSMNVWVYQGLLKLNF